MNPVLTFRQLFLTLFILFAVFLFASALSAWTGPAATAPGSNVTAPINAGTTDQVKNAGLSVNALTVYGSEYIQNKLGIGIADPSNPAVTLDVNGTIKIGNAGELCQAVSAGAIRYNSTSNTIEYCNGTAWGPISSGASCSLGVLKTQSYTTAGTYTFTVPSGFNSLMVVVRGAGGGGGGIYAGTGGSDGGASSFDSVSASGGSGGAAGNTGGSYPGKGAYEAGPCHFPAPDGAGSGGDINKTGGGATGGIGAGAVYSCYAPSGISRYGTDGGNGGVGGLTSKLYNSSTLTPGSQISVTVGAAGSTQGGAAQDGSVDIIWYDTGASAPAVTPGTQTYSTPGTYTFTVPQFNVLTAIVNGAGGGGGGGGVVCGRGCPTAGSGSAGGNSQFDTTLANGGGGGGGAIGGGRGTPGDASGGDIDVTGGGASGGAGGVGGWGTGGTGGTGGFLSKTYTSASALTPGSSVTVVVGDGGAGGAGGNAPGGSNGTGGSVYVTWQ